MVNAENMSNMYFHVTNALFARAFHLFITFELIGFSSQFLNQLASWYLFIL